MDALRRSLQGQVSLPPAVLNVMKTALLCAGALLVVKMLGL